MAIRKRAPRTAGPVSIAVSAEQRKRLEAEARRRGLGVSPTIRTLALERLSQIQEERQLTRARQWQVERALEVVDASERGEIGESTWEEIEKIFDEALAELRGRNEATRR